MAEDELLALFDKRNREIDKNALSRTENDRRNEVVRKLYDAWIKIHESPPVDSKNQIDQAAIDDWLNRFCDRIESFLCVLQETDFAEFLPFLQSRTDAEMICAELLNQEKPSRLKTMRAIPMVPGGFTDWHMPFSHHYMLDWLMTWSLWMNATSYAERKRAYQHRCHEAQLAVNAVVEQHLSRAYKHCDEQYRRLLDDPRRPESEIPARFDWHSLDDGSDWQPIDVFNKKHLLAPAENAKLDILVYGMLKDQEIVNQWYDDGCPMDNIPPIKDSRFRQLVRLLRFQLDLNPPRMNESDSGWRFQDFLRVAKSLKTEIEINAGHLLEVIHSISVVQDSLNEYWKVANLGEISEFVSIDNSGRDHRHQSVISVHQGVVGDDSLFVKSGYYLAAGNPARPEEGCNLHQLIDTTLEPMTEKEAKKLHRNWNAKLQGVWGTETVDGAVHMCMIQLNRLIEYAELNYQRGMPPMIDAPVKNDRLIVLDCEKQILVDDVSYFVDDPDTLQIFDVLVATKDRLSMTEIKKQCPNIADSFNVTKWRNGLPNALKKVLDTNTNGTRIHSEFL